ncbi:hypothetical protein YC2023_031927 [Brassica napus]
MYYLNIFRLGRALKPSEKQVKEWEKQKQVKEWEEARCPVCMEHLKFSILLHFEVKKNVKE